MARMNIAIFGKTNSGKSTLFNCLLAEEVAIISPVKGTTTDAVYKATEMGVLGAVTLIDTAGFDDESALGQKRIKGTLAVLDKADIALLVTRNIIQDDIENEWLDRIKSKHIPYILVYNIASNLFALDKHSIFVNAAKGEGIASLCNMIQDIGAERDSKLFDGLVSKGDVVLLVMPQDVGAPQGRLILPQSTAVRELVDIGAVSICVSLESLPHAMSQYGSDISLVVTDSSVFGQVSELCEGVRLTSFSVLYAKVKGDIELLAEGAQHVDRLGSDARIMVLEACSHTTSHEDIGQVKIPAMLRKRLGENITVDFVRNRDTLPDVGGYDLVVHCGGCMLGKRAMINRLQAINAQGVHVTNYGLLIAKLNGVLDKIVY